MTQTTEAAQAALDRGFVTEDCRSQQRRAPPPTVPGWRSNALVRSARIPELAAGLFDVCRDVEVAVVNHPSTLAEYWGRANAIRHAHTVREMLTISRGTTLRVLNASGLGIGHQDFAISSLLRRQGVRFDWIALDSARSPYVARPAFQDLLRHTGVQLRLIDYSAPSPLSNVDGVYDAILFTEIAEHLDHSALLRSLAALNPRLAPEGRLILTTPNAVALGTRLRFLCGVADGPFWGDGQANREAGLYGHITQYDRTRLHRLLNDSGFSPARSYTFDYEPESGALLKRLLWPALKTVVPDSRGTVFISAQTSAPVAIPFVV